MASLTVYDAVRARVDGQWSLCPVSWPNEPFTLPSDLWMQVEMEGRLWSQVSLGSGDPLAERWDESGTLWGHFFAPAGSGERDIRAAAGQWIDLFRGREIGAIEFQDAVIGPGGPDEDGNWWRISARIDFVRR